MGTVARPDEMVQLTLGGWPVYRYAKDRGPADLAGHGVGGTWFAVTPTGDKAAAADAGRAAAAASGTPDQTPKAVPMDSSAPRMIPHVAAAAVRAHPAEDRRDDVGPGTSDGSGVAINGGQVSRPKLRERR